MAKIASTSTKGTRPNKAKSKTAPSSVKSKGAREPKVAAAEAAKKQPTVRTDIAQEITDRILAELTAGALPWVKPWRALPTSGMPSNFSSGRPYSGVNVLTLWAAQEVAGYPTAQWISYDQAAALGGQVRKGERGTKIVFVGSAEKKDDNGEKDGSRYSFLRSFSVFNVAQCDGLPVKEQTDRRVADITARDVWADAFLAATAADIREGTGEAFYIPSRDYINVPSFPSFKTPDHYYATTFHEVGHWTGAEKRLDRNIKNGFGSIDYAFEELVAELTSAFLCAEFGFNGEVRHAGYIEHWIKLLKDDKGAFMKAASKASKAHQFLRDLAIAEGAPTSAAIDVEDQPLQRAA